MADIAHPAVSLIPADPEMRLLVASVAAQVDPCRITGLQGAIDRVRDWERVIDAAILHSVFPILYNQLSYLQPSGVPAEALERLRDLTYRNSARNTFLISKMFEVLELFKSQHVRALPFKGPVIAMQLYGDSALRRYDDLDFLVHPHDMERARTVFLDHGFQPHVALTDAQAHAYMRAGWELIFKSTNDDYSIELDSGVAPAYFSFFIGIDRLWLSSKTVSIDGRDVKTLSPENLLLLLCAHGAKHGWHRLIWIADIASLVRMQREFDFSLIMDRAYLLGGERMLLLGMALIRDLLGAEIPDVVEAAIRRDRVIPCLEDQVGGFLWRPREHARLDTASILFHLSARERLRDRAAYVLKMAVTPTYGDWTLVSLPRRLFFLYYVLRPFRLAWRALKWAIKKKPALRRAPAESASG